MRPPPQPFSSPVGEAGNSRILIRPSSTTAKTPAQSNRIENADGRSCCHLRRLGTNSKQDDARSGRNTGAKRKLTEVLVEGDQHARLVLRSGQHLRIASTRRVLVHPRNIVSGATQCVDGWTRNVLVGKQTGAHSLYAVGIR
jgi:hypothetical protein